MKIYKTKLFNKWQTKYSELVDDDLLQAVFDMNGGLYDAALGGYLYKKRVARNGAGKRSGYRTIVATQLAETWIFIFGFAKNDKENINNTELKALQKLAELLLNYDNVQVKQALLDGYIIEVKAKDEKE